MIDVDLEEEKDYRGACQFGDYDCPGAYSNLAEFQRRPNEHGIGKSDGKPLRGVHSRVEGSWRVGKRGRAVVRPNLRGKGDKGKQAYEEHEDEHLSNKNKECLRGG